MGFATLLAGTVLIGVCGAIAVIDIRVRRIPDALTLLLAATGGLAAAAAEDRLPWERCASALVAMAMLWAMAALFRRWRGVPGLGLGDVKMMGAAALWIAPWNLPLVLLVACAAALVTIALAASAGRLPDRGTRIPFGPFIGAGLVITWALETSGVPTLMPVGL